MNVKLISITKPVEKLLQEGITSQGLISYIARVSNPDNQMNLETAPKLLNYLLNNKHWSPYEFADFTVEIKTSRAIAAQLLRHKSFSFQERSLRYTVPIAFEPVELRKQAKKNRQSSEEVIEDERLARHVEASIGCGIYTYNELLKQGVSKETARMVLPLATQTVLYMKGSLRSWITYLMVRLDEHTQKEHREIAEEIKKIVRDEFPDIAEALGWR